MEDNPDFEQLILNHVNGENYRPVKPGVMAKQLGLSKEQVRDVKKFVKRLIKRGKLAWGSSHLVLPANQNAIGQVRTVIGVFRKAAGGYGFVRPNDVKTTSRDEDIFISERKTLDAASGDIVAVRLGSSRGKRFPQKQRGEIIEVLERETHQFVGTYSEQADLGYVQVDGTVFAQEILVGDAGAKNARPGDKVVIEMVRFPSHVHDGEGVILELLGKKSKPGVDTLTIIREFNLPEQFPEHVLEAARHEAEKFDESIGGHRRDFSDLTIITIDPKDARDFDDAISLERIENDHWRLGVHIADVSHFIQPKSPLDEEARKRATSVYLPDRVIPMLPEIVSNNLASLQPNRVRYTKSAFIELTPDGARVATEVFSGAIKSKRRFTYEEVDEFLSDRSAWKTKLAPEVYGLLERMYELAMIMRRRRMDDGAIELTLPEIKIDLDNHGRVSGAHVVENTESHQIIEEFMLSANEAVAELLKDKKLSFLRRVHEQPSPKKLVDLTRFVRDLGISCESLESRFEIKRVIEQVADRPERHAVNYAVLRSMQKAHYSPVEEGHYALSSRAYCHFTSPIRRYPDLTIHRAFDLLASGKYPTQDFGELTILGQHCSDREQRAEKAERELIKVKLLNYLGNKIGEQMDAIITGVEEYGLFAQGVKLPAEGLIHINSLQDDYYDYDGKARMLTGRRAGNSYRLGDLIQVEIAHVDVDRRELDFRLIKTTKKRKVTKSKRKTSAPQTSKKKQGKKKAGKKRTAGRKKKKR